MSNKTNLRDPIHNYIYLTDVEESVVEHHLFQRLRYISQNGAAYYTYPSNRHDRFLHSLGVMKIGGDIFLNASEDLLDDDVKDFLITSYQYIKKIANNLGVTIISATEDFAQKKNQTFIKYGLNLDEDLCFVKKELDRENSNTALKLTKAILFQSLRLACLLHDVGHFPYSHTIEYALGDYISELQEKKEKLNHKESKFLEDYLNMKKYLEVETVDKALHEMIGIKILDEILPSANLTDFQRLCRLIAKQILTKQEQEPVLQTLYEIVSGELDADRLDYSLRDPKSSGLELGQIDMERLLNNFTLIKENNIFEILPKVQALSTIETFYHQRYLNYKYLIYHHSKVRMDQILGEITKNLLAIYFGETDRHGIKGILEKNHFHFLWSKLNGSLKVNDQEDNYFYCDEGWFNSLIKEIYHSIKDLNIKEKEISTLLLLIKTFIFRKTENIVTLLKRYDNYLNLFDNVLKIVEREKEITIKHSEFIKECFDLILVDEEINLFKEDIRKKHDILLLIKMTPPKSIAFDNEGNSKLKIIVGTQKNTVPIQRLSPYLDSQKLMIESDQLFHIFLIGENIKTKEIVSQIETELFNFIANMYLKELNK